MNDEERIKKCKQIYSEIELAIADIRRKKEEFNSYAKKLSVKDFISIAADSLSFNEESRSNPKSFRTETTDSKGFGRLSSPDTPDRLSEKIRKDSEAVKLILSNSLETDKKYPDVCDNVNSGQDNSFEKDFPSIFDKHLGNQWIGISATPNEIIQECCRDNRRIREVWRKLLYHAKIQSENSNSNIYAAITSELYYEFNKEWGL